ncbi:respiratory chain complex I subunit 1 family protein [Methanocorpusculum vombati]|uniref:NADH-quinone oxidoreductase subunit H n=1 Tax=Methanocorpusculum vombati TaxID=3002864 RepID=A0ABT4INN6_9EURY|nr:complex I subunit 1 family protein [Methanocorpusculum vombati]MCZ9320035.1 NADH-quinone oxidoreductase subunit H [Methanocorpusculum sp.]MCZ0863361.1 NADH-quinone oxidoreductase subunit H [Methanocorpusculum vombati]MDE2520174.1 NADH-quinone oxidoreductase subunit H [Methanocorpusculum sp.]MDE2534859.1 NADH-quinone oxidoreductase subunit H [Methanocorpusculum sp.]MDE2545956.1 NADH-quinone oxidoreductase subunit H [Methanocorpusculum sp.]
MNPVLGAVGGTIVLAILAIAFGLILSGIDRRVVARMQARVGPPLLQPFTDVRKLLAKQNIVPANAIPWLFHAMPIVALASAIAILLYLPFGSFAPVLGEFGDVILVLYLLIIPSLALVIGGFASGSPYATVGAQREMVSMIAYELPLAVAVIAIAWRLMAAGVADPFSMLTLMQTSVWDVVGPLGMLALLILLVMMAWVTPGELSKIPFDSPEAETELAGGILVEYSGKNLGLFTLSQAVKMVAMSAFGIILLLPWNLSPFLGLTGAAAGIADLVFFLVKVLFVVIVSVTVVRTMMARFRITQVVGLYWLVLGVLGALAVILMMADAVLLGAI